MNGEYLREERSEVPKHVQKSKITKFKVNENEEYPPLSVYNQSIYEFLTRVHDSLKKCKTIIVQISLWALT